jgi:hypothetical protein
MNVLLPPAWTITDISELRPSASSVTALTGPVCSSIWQVPSSRAAAGLLDRATRVLARIDEAAAEEMRLSLQQRLDNTARCGAAPVSSEREQPLVWPQDGGQRSGQQEIRG